MKRVTLSNKEIEECLSIPDISARKTYIQNIFNNIGIKSEWVLHNLKVGIGKSFQCISLIKRIRAVTQEEIIIVVPNDDLKKNWIKRLENITNVSVWVINSYTKPGITHSCHTLIVDEVDTAANSESKYFSTLFDITERKYTITLAAVLEKTHLDFLQSKGLNTITYLEESVMNKLNLIPKSEILNVPVDFTASEKYNYIINKNKITEIDNFFSCLQLEKRLHYLLPMCLKNKNLIEDWKDTMLLNGFDDKNLNGIIIGKAILFMKLIKERQSILQNAYNKKRILKKILDEEQSSGFIFFGNVDTIKKYSDLNIVEYHSKLSKTAKKQNMNLFLTTDASIASVKAINKGFDLETVCEELEIPYKDIHFGVNVGFNSSKIDIAQRNGRSQRLDKTNDKKISRFYNLYVDDFTHNNIEYISQEKIWLAKAQEGLFTKIKIYAE